MCERKSHNVKHSLKVKLQTYWPGLLNSDVLQDDVNISRNHRQFIVEHLPRHELTASAQGLLSNYRTKRPASRHGGQYSSSGYSMWDLWH
jgi:hypothetical protein